MNEFGSWIREIRERKGDSQTRAAQTLHITQPQWSKYEVGPSVPPEERWAAFADYLGVTVDEFRARADQALAERQGQNDPTLDLEARVAQLTAAVERIDAEQADQAKKLEAVETIGDEQKKQAGMIEMIGRLLGVKPDNPAPARRGPSRRAK